MSARAIKCLGRFQFSTRPFKTSASTGSLLHSTQLQKTTTPLCVVYMPPSTVFLSTHHPNSLHNAILMLLFCLCYRRNTQKKNSRRNPVTIDLKETSFNVKRRHVTFMSVMIWWNRAPMALPNSLSTVTVSVSIINKCFFFFSFFFQIWLVFSQVSRRNVALECQTTFIFT